MSFIISAFISTLLEIDEVYSERLPDGRLKVVFVTTGLADTTAKIKTAIWALLAPPVQRVDDVQVEELQSGLISKRYKVTVYLKPLVGGRR